MKVKSYEIENLVIRRYAPSDYPLWKEGVENRLPPQNEFDVGRVSSTDKQYFYDFLTYMGKRQKIDKTYLYAIFDKDSGKHLGVLEFTILLRDKVNWGMYGISIHNQFWGQKIGTLATLKAEEIAKDLKIKRLECNIEIGNERSERIFVKGGYTFECIRKNFYFNGEKYNDVLVYYKDLGENK